MQGTNRWISGLMVLLSWTSMASAHSGHIEHDLPAALVATTLLGLPGVGLTLSLRRARRPVLSAVIGAVTAAMVGMCLLGM